MKKLSLLVFLLFSFVATTIAQRTITGTITDLEGVPLIGANVLAAGTSIGTITDIDGSFSLSVPDGTNQLEVSYTGFENMVVDISESSTVNVALSEGKLLDEVVVTALGVERNARNVVYANESVSSDDLLSAPNKNTLEALRGKAAGVKITTGSGSVGASSKIVLRSEASLTGNNNALIVVDGIPIDNNSVLGGEGGGESGYADYGNRFNDINPEDIANVTILKGPSATALYGSRGASGVLLITTKKGKSGKPKINFSSTTSIDQAYVLLERQDQYGQGLINPDGSNNFDSGENFSWGPAYDGVVRPWTSPVDTDGDGTLEYLSRPYSVVPNQLENFFRTGRTNTNSLSLSGGTDDFSYYASYANTYQRGILENTDYKRNNFAFNATAKFTERLRSSFNLSYAIVDQNTALEGSRAFEGRNAYANAIQAPTNIPYNEIRDYNSPFHDFKGYYGSYTVNPYFVLNEYTNNGKVNNFLGNFSLSYDLLDNLTLDTKVGANIVTSNITEITPQYAYEDHLVWGDQLALSDRGGRQVNAGLYLRTDDIVKNLDVTTKAVYNMSLDDAGSKNLRFIVGNNIFDRRRNRTTAQTQGGLLVPGIYNLANSVEQSISSQSDSDYRLVGFFGNVSFDMDNRLFLEYSARKDYSSTLPVDNQGFFYQALGASAVLSDYFNTTNSSMNFLKARASFGTTGKDAGLYLLESIFNGNPTLANFSDVYAINSPINGQSTASQGGRIGNPELKPEITTTLELGFDAGFFDDRISLNYTYYSSDHDDQIVSIGLPRTSGFTSTAANVGKITNRGHEIGLNLRPLSPTSDFKWDVNLTFAKNTNEVVKISDDTDELVIYDSGRGVTLVAQEGQPFGTFKGQVPTYDPNGNPIVAGGLPVYTTETFDVGNVQPDWIGSLGSSLGYKNFKLSFLLDTRQGSEFFSLTKSATEFNGTAVTTTFNDRQPYIIENSVVEVVSADGTVSYEPNTTETLIDAVVFDGNYTRNILDGSFIKLREVGIDYTFPKSFTKSLNVSNVTLGFFGKNLKYWLAEGNTFGDPEANGPGTAQSNVTGIETSQTPSTRSLGVRLNVQF